MNLGNRTNQERIRSEKDLVSLAEHIKQSFSFNYKTIADARKTINVGIYSYVFDATTLFAYDSNINWKEGRLLNELLQPIFKNMNDLNREEYKELCERIVLLRFLLCAPEQYQKYSIEKHIHPDFILKGNNKTIGVEVTELTTQFDKEFFALFRQIQENRLKSEEEIKRHILRYHKSIASRVICINNAGTSNISTDCYHLTPNLIHFAEEIKTKYNKYKDKVNQYDEFIILGDAASGSGLEISNKNDLREMISRLLMICPDIVNVTTVIAWREEKHQEKIIHSWYRNTTQKI